MSSPPEEWLNDWLPTMDELDLRSRRRWIGYVMPHGAVSLPPSRAGRARWGLGSTLRARSVDGWQGGRI